MLIEVCDTCICEQRIIPNPRHAKTLTCKTFTQSAMSSTLFFALADRGVALASPMAYVSGICLTYGLKCQRVRRSMYLPAWPHASCAVRRKVLQDESLPRAEPHFCGLLCIAAGPTSVYRSLPRPQMQATSKSSTRPNLSIGVS